MIHIEKRIIININDICPNLRVINLYQCAPGLDTGFRRLYDYYFLYVHKGKGVISIGDQKYPTTPGDLYFIPPGIPNSIVADQDDPFLLTGLNFDFTLNQRDQKFAYPIQAESYNPHYTTEVVEFNDFGGFPSKMSLNEDSQTKDFIYSMIHQFNLQEKYWENYTSALLHAFIIGVIRGVTNNEIGVKSKGDLNKIITYLSENYMEDLTNTKVARIFHYHPDYLSKLVYAYTGLTLKQYIINLRIREALNLLMNSNTQIKDISVKVGYNNLHYFTHIFKLKTGFSPAYYRQNFKPVLVKLEKEQN